MNRHTSFEFSKLLWDNESILESEISVIKFKKSGRKNYRLNFKKVDIYGDKSGTFYGTDYVEYPAYDILWDICVKYRNEFFGDENNLENKHGFEKLEYNQKIIDIVIMIKNNLPQAEIEKYIWDNCLFNPKNKEVKNDTNF